MKRRIPLGVLLVALLHAATSSPEASGDPAGGRSGPQLSGDFVLEFAPSAGSATRRQALESFHLEVVREVPHTGFAQVRAGPGVTPSEAALIAHPAIVAVDRLTAARAAAVQPPDDPYFSLQWNLPLIQVPDAWEVSTGIGATVAVLDTGVAFEAYHDPVARVIFSKAPDFAGTTFVAGYDFVDNDAHPNDAIDYVSPEGVAHGTHVAATIAETAGNGLGVAGVAPGTAIMPVRVLRPDGSGDDVGVAAGLVFAADHGADVVNMSLTVDNSNVMAAAVRYAASKGVTMVASGGNDNVGTVDYPAAYPEVLAVGAVTRQSVRAHYSNYGDALDISAPGGDIRLDPKDGIIAESFQRELDGFNYFSLEGTSAAASHVSAVAALLVGSGLASTPEQVRHALLSSALDLGSPGTDVFTGAGLVQARAALAAAHAATADLSVVLSDGPDPVQAGSALTYTAAVSNKGPATATAVTATASLPPGVSLESAVAGQGSCAASGGVVRCSLGTLAAGATASVTIVIRPVTAGSVTHTVTVAGAEGDGRRADNTSTTTTTVTPEIRTAPPTPVPGGLPSAPGADHGRSDTGYIVAGADGGVYAFGGARFLGSTGAMRLNSPVVGAASIPSGNGYWLVASDGGVFAFGDARFAGSAGAIRLRSPVVGMAATPSGNGYWLVASDGGVFAFGDARFRGSAGAIRLASPVVGTAATPTGNGYWLAASDGGIFAFGDARFSGSTGASSLGRPIVGVAGTRAGNGYWLVGADGGIFAFGDARFSGSTGGSRLNQPVVGMASGAGSR